MPNSEAQFLETRKFQVSEICRIYRVPPHMVGDLEHATFSNIEHQSISFAVHTIRPWVVRLEQQCLPQWRHTPPNRNGGTSMRRTIRKTFLLEGETVTMKYVKQLCGEERYGRMIEDAKKKFFADPTIDLCYPTPAGYLTIWFQLA